MDKGYIKDVDNKALDFFSPYVKCFTSNDRVKFTLDFATENLFSPLGIYVENSLMFRSKEEQLSFNEATDINGGSVILMGSIRMGMQL